MNGLDMSRDTMAEKRMEHGLIPGTTVYIIIAQFIFCVWFRDEDVEVVLTVNRLLVVHRQAGFILLFLYYWLGLEQLETER